MVRAFRQVDRKVHHRKAKRAGLQIVAHAFFDRGDILFRHDPAGHRVSKGKSIAARQRLDFDHHVAKLAMPARLLFVAAAHLG